MTRPARRAPETRPAPPHGGPMGPCAGQATTFVLACLVMMTVFVALVLYVGQAVNRRIALQVVADASAYSGASRQAEGLNAIAKLNLWRARTLPAFATAVGLIPWPSDTPTVYGWLAAYDVRFTRIALEVWNYTNIALQGMQEAINVGYALAALDTAGATHDHNVRELFPGEHREVRGAESGLPIYLQYKGICTEYAFSVRNEGSAPETTTLPRPCLTELQAREIVDFYLVHGIWVLTPLGPVFIPNGTVSHEYFAMPYKREGPPIGYAWVVDAPPVRPLFNPFNLFPDIPAMQAAAFAKPTGGNIEAGDDSYVAVMLPLARARIFRWRDFLPSEMQGFLPEGFFVQDTWADKWRKVVY